MFSIWNNQIKTISRRDEGAVIAHRDRGATLKVLNMIVPEGSVFLRHNFVTRRSRIVRYARSSMPRSGAKALDQMKRLFLGKA